MAARFPPLEHEPRVHSMLLSAVPLASKLSHDPAPPPYRSIASVHDEDLSGWSPGSSTVGSTEKRRSSWTNLVDMGDDPQLLKAKLASSFAPSYPKVASSTASAYSASPPTLISGNPKGRPTSFTSGSVFSDVHKPASYRPNFMQPSDYPPPMSGPPRPGTAASNVPSDRHREPPPSQSRPKRDRMADLRNLWSKPSCKLTCCCICLLLLIAVVVAVVLTSALALPKHLKMQWLAPDLHRHGNTNPNAITMDVADQQIRLELNGNPPFKSNYVSVLDFQTNKIAIVDSALKSPGGQNMICFVMDLDRDNIKSIEAFQRAARNAEKKRTQTRGWDESWNFIPQVLNEPPAGQFRPDVAECRGARWVALNYVNQYQKNQRCTDCFDFCLPQFGVEHDNIRDETTLNVLRRNCFYLYIPEWRGYAYQTSNQQQQNLPPNWPVGLGGPQSQDGSNGNGGIIGAIGAGINQLGHQIGQNSAVQQALGNAESKWTDVKNAIPQHVLNGTQEAFQNLRANVNQWGQQVFGGGNGGPPNRNAPSLTEIFSQSNGQQPTVVPPVPQPHQAGGFPSSLGANQQDFNRNPYGQSSSLSQYPYGNQQPQGQSPPGLFGSQPNAQSPYQTNRGSADGMNGLAGLHTSNQQSPFPPNQPQQPWGIPGPQNNWGTQPRIDNPPSQFGMDLSAQRNQQSSPQFNANNPQQQQNGNGQQGWINVGSG
ncbi:hypothetical protein M3Y99_01193000 [Aphelenchoides fujianensis]|nr:hypothetical protein M3Y99_01193000 [Aphelenchoides fujianensis]